MNIILLGAPGAGKGTQAMLMSARLDLPHVSTGEYFRRIIAQKTELGLLADGYISKGNLVPDDIVVRIVAQRLQEPDCRHGFILDGYPRTLVQAKELKKLYNIDCCICIEVDPEKMVARILGRRTCKDCGKNFHVDFHDVSSCDACGGSLFRREDDREETIRERLKVYSILTEPLIDYYRQEGILVEVDGLQVPEKVFDQIMQSILHS